MTRSFIYAAMAVCGFTLAEPVAAQSPCSQAYRIVYKTVYDQEPVTTFRLQYDTELDAAYLLPK